MLAVARWFMSTLWGSYASRCTNGQTEKKPYNPILGEQFHCKLGDIDCICEQGMVNGSQSLVANAIVYMFYSRVHTI